MRFATAVAAAGFVGAAVAQNATAPDVYVTDVVTAYTTYCPEATKFTHAGSTYTVSEATTLTITNCPGGCTITKPVSSSTPVAPVMTSASVSAATSAPVVAPAPYSTMSSAVSAAVPYPSTNGTAVAPVGASGTAAGTGSGSSPTGTGAPIQTGAASQVSAYGAGFMALFGLVALI